MQSLLFFTETKLDIEWKQLESFYQEELQQTLYR